MTPQQKTDLLDLKKAYAAKIRAELEYTDSRNDYVERYRKYANGETIKRKFDSERFEVASAVLAVDYSISYYLHNGRGFQFAVGEDEITKAQS